MVDYTTLGNERQQRSDRGLFSPIIKITEACSSTSAACQNGLCKENADLRAKLVALRDAANDANEWTWTCYSSVEDMCIKGDYKEEIFAHLSIVSDKLKTALDSVKDVKP